MKKSVEKQLHIIGSTTNSRNKHRSNRFFSEDEFENSQKDYQRKVRQNAPRPAVRTAPKQRRASRLSNVVDVILRKKKPIIIIGAVIICLLVAVILINSNKKEIVKEIMKSELGASVADNMVGESYSKNVWDSNFKRDQVVINDGVTTPEGYKVIALFGIDAREDDLKKNSRSDSMIVLSFNEENGDVKMGSVFRDTYLVGDCNEKNEYYIGKANAAYMIGGPEKAINMLNRNWDLAITDYVVVNFAGLSNIIDAMGGLTLQVTEEEIKEINYHMKGQIDSFGGEYVELEDAGEVRMNGAQATTFCRIRSVDFVSPLDGQTYSIDFGRTARQRYALNELFKEAKEAGISKLIGTINEVCENNVGDNKFIMTSLPLDELMQLLSGFMDMNIAGQDAFPHTDKSYITMLDSGSTVVANTLEENAKLFHEFLFGQNDYMLSNDFYTYSTWISRWVNLQKTGNPDITYDPDAPVVETVTEPETQAEEYYETLPYEYISEDTGYENYEYVDPGYSYEGETAETWDNTYTGGETGEYTDTGTGETYETQGEGDPQWEGDTGVTETSILPEEDTGSVQPDTQGTDQTDPAGGGGEEQQVDTGQQEIPQDTQPEVIETQQATEPAAGPVLEQTVGSEG